MKLLAIAALCTGCVTVQAAAQNVEGEVQLLAARKPLDDPHIPARTRKLLSKIATIKTYGESQGLKPTENYEQYVEVHKSAVVYVVTACRPLAFEPKTRSFPIAGSFPYLGWFIQASATQYAKELEQDGWDVDVRGASAFSTLGWFHDPVLSTMLTPGPEAIGDLVNTVLHESVHATLHVEGQSYFNESLASFVADRLTEKYLAGQKPSVRRAWLDQQQHYRQVQEEFRAAYQGLDELYKSTKSQVEKREQKAKLLEELKQKLQWKRRLNNATLMGFRTYDSGTAGFEKLLASCKDDYRCFFGKLRGLKFEKEQQEDFDSLIARLSVN